MIAGKLPGVALLVVLVVVVKEKGNAELHICSELCVIVRTVLPHHFLRYWYHHVGSIHRARVSMY